MSADLGRRLSVAAIGIPATVVVTLAGGYWFAAGLSALAVVAVWEMGRMLEERGDRFLYAPGMALAGLLPLAALRAGTAGLWFLTMIAVVTVIGVATLRIPPAGRPFGAASRTTLAGLYVGGLLSFGVGLREMFSIHVVEGTLYFFLPVAVTWLTDTAAYFGGKRFGRRRLAPVVSPNKTVEGGIVGLIAGPIGAIVYGFVLLPELADALGLAGLSALGLVVASAATMGDLAESALKRECGVKDSSGLLPGHGGLLDRMDSLLWSIPVAFLFLRAVL